MSAAQKTPCGHLPLTTCRLCEGPNPPPGWTAPPSAALRTSNPVQVTQVPVRAFGKMLDRITELEQSNRELRDALSRLLERSSLDFWPIEQELARAVLAKHTGGAA